MERGFKGFRVRALVRLGLEGLMFRALQGLGLRVRESQRELHPPRFDEADATETHCSVRYTQSRG